MCGSRTRPVPRTRCD
ncbi:MAG: hypothetical protein EOS70_02925 [Mesorhizobium sp.]|nr:MAG: hypothetical protein EOS70_02925 [Mesorhizobium sp.]